jgi:hypothetical protein
MNQQDDTNAATTVQPVSSTQPEEASPEAAVTRLAAPPLQTRTSNWFVRHWIISLLGLSIASYALVTRDRTVKWEEEIALNTGEALIVKRKGEYRYVVFNAGHGETFYHRPEENQKLEFSYKGKTYSFSGEAEIILIAVGPNGVPTLVADARQWRRHTKYSCVTPDYVQFQPNADGKTWVWPNQIEPWLYNLPSNLILGLIDLKDDGKRLKPDEYKEAKNIGMVSPRYSKVDPSIKPENCY